MKKILMFGLLLAVAVSCSSSKKIIYLQDGAEYGRHDIEVPSLKIEPNDLIDIVVTCPNPELAIPFNDYGVNVDAQGRRSGNSSRQQYIVSEDGYIIFPILGMLKVQGKTCNEVSAMIVNMIVENQYLQDPSVSTKITNFTISVMGAVRIPGMYSVGDQKMTIFEALSRAGDLDIQGKRYDITIVRETGGVREIGYVDLRNKSIFESPYYYLKQGDMIYVEPNRARINSSADRQAATLTISAVSVLVSVSTLLITISLL